MAEPGTDTAEDLWCKLYVLCFARRNYPTLHSAMAALPTDVKVKIDDSAHAIIAATILSLRSELEAHKQCVEALKELCAAVGDLPTAVGGDADDLGSAYNNAREALAALEQAQLGKPDGTRTASVDPVALPRREGKL